MNTFKSTLLLVVLTLFLILIGDYFGGQNGMVLAFLLSLRVVASVRKQAAV